MHIELWAPTTRCARLRTDRLVDVLGGGGCEEGEEKGRARRTVSERLLCARVESTRLVITLELASGSVQGEEDRAPPSLVRGAKSHGNRFM